MSEQPEPTLSVWLATEATDHRAMHDVIAIFTPGYTYVWEPAGWSEVGAAEALLAAAGFQGGGEPGLTVREVPCDVPIVLHRGFSAPQSKWPQIQEAVHRALTGQLGGFFPVVASQAFFHRSAVAFEYAWAAAGQPPIEVRPPGLVPGARAEDGTPGAVDRAALDDPRVRAARRAPAAPRPPEEEPLDPWTRGPIEGEDPSDEEVPPSPLDSHVV